jgi:multicomponent Na+:H+ antiporter subunit G
VAELIGSILVLLGAMIHFSAGVGLLRMPDAYTRLQAVTKATTLGNTLILFGIAFYHPDWTWKLLLIVYFVFMTNPISSHALARACWVIGIPMAGSDDTAASRNGVETESRR